MNTLSVSRKVYADITARIKNSLFNRESSIAEAIRLVDEYLAGNADAISYDTLAMLAFNMVKAELDRAMVRSARARERGRKAREAREAREARAAKEVATARVENDTEEADEVGKIIDAMNAVAPVPLSRRERRAIARATAKAKKKPSRA